MSVALKRLGGGHGVRESERFPELHRCVCRDQWPGKHATGAERKPWGQRGSKLEQQEKGIPAGVQLGRG